MAVRIRLGVVISGANGEWFRLSPPWDTDGGTITPATMTPWITYPDRRVKSFSLFVAPLIDDPNDPLANTYGKYRRKDFPALASEKANLAYADIGAYDFTALWESPLLPEFSADEVTALETSSLESDPNVVLTSTPYKPRNILGRHVQYIGNDSEDAVVCFKSPSKEVSSGQFGQFPLYAFCRRSAYALEVGTGDTAFLRAIPLEVNRGAISTMAAESVDRAIVYASRDGVYRAGEKSEIPVSFPLHDGDFTLDEKTALHYFTDLAAGRRELWVSTGLRILAYSLDYKRWFSIDGERKQFVEMFGKTISLGGDGKLYREGAGVGGDGQVKMAPIHLGEPDLLKRFRRVIARVGTLDFLFLYNTTGYSFTFTWKPIQGDFHGLTVEAEARYAHRVRSQSDQGGE